MGFQVSFPITIAPTGMRTEHLSTNARFVHMRLQMHIAHCT